MGNIRFAGLVVGSLLWALGADAAAVRLRLVRAEAPDQKVSTAVTMIDVDAERARLAAEQRLTTGGSKGGLATEKQEELRPRAEFDRYCNYMRGITVDGQFPFQRAYQGSYLGRSDEITLNLPDGEHWLDPGHHVFRLANGQLTTTDPALRVRDGVLEVLLYAVTIIAMDGSAVRQMPAEVLRLPVAPRLYWGKEAIIPKEDQVADGATFKRLTLYVAANATGAPYRVSPSEREFRVTPDGVTVLDEQGQPATDRSVYVEGQFTIVLPKVSVPVFLRGPGLSVSISGPAGSFSAQTATGLGVPQEERRKFAAFGSRVGAQIRFGGRAENAPVQFRGDFGAFPRRQLLFDATAPGVAEPRYFAVALAPGAARAGGSLRARIEAVDALGAATITPFQPTAYLLTTPVLQADGTLLSNPEPTTPAEQWQRLTVRAMPEADEYLLEVPATVASGVYYLRVVGDRRGQCAPQSLLQLNFVQGVVNPAATATLSVFCPNGRRAFFRGAELPFSVVLKTTGEHPGGPLRVVLKSTAGEFLLREQPVPAAKAGVYPFHFVLGGEASQALRAGAYALTANLGGLASNQWPVMLVQARDPNGTPQFDDGWLSVNFDADLPYQNVPDSIRMANDKWARLRRQAGIRAQRTDLQIVDWSGSGGGHGNYQGRDNASEVAQVEALLRGELALPAPEVYYYQNHFEMVNEALTTWGLDHVTSAPCFISQLSLPHSIRDQLDAKMRQYQLIAQIGRKFEGFVGLNPLFMNTSPLGNSEIPDPTRHERLLTMERNFQAKYGFPAPTQLEATEYIQAVLKGQAPAHPEVGTRWEAYETMVNHLMPDYYAMIRQAVEPLHPRLQHPNRGPSWGGDTGGGTYPEFCHANQEPLVVFTGHGDSGHDCIWEPYFRTMLARTSGRACWGVDGALYNCPAVKHNLGLYLAAGATGFGYLGGPKPESGTGYRKEYARVAQDILDVKEFLHAYGPLLRRLQHRGEVAVFYSFTQSAYNDVAIERHDDLQTLNAALMQLAALGYTTEILTEQRLAAGDAPRFKVVVAPLVFYLLPAARDALEKYAAGGGRLLVGANSTVVPKGALKLADDFQEHAQARSMWSFQGPVDLASAYILGEMRRKLPELRQALAPAVSPVAAPQTDTVLVQTAQAGDARYTFVCNLLYPSFMGTPRLTGNPQVSGPIGEANENTLMPQQVALQVPAAVATYDVLALRALAGAPAANGQALVTCDLAHTPFRLVASLPEPVTRLRLETPAEVVLGRTFPLRVTALGREGRPLKVVLPIEVRLSDAGGEAVPTVYGVAAPDETVTLSADVGYRPGTWKLTVRELAGGRKVETTVVAKAPDRLPFGAAVQAGPVVEVQDAALIRGFITARRQDAQPVLLLLDESQAAARTELAKELAAALTGLGVKAEIRAVNAPGVFGQGERMRTFGRLREMGPDQYLPHHVVLLGGEGENVLLEELQESRFLRRPLSASYPGPGRGVLALVRSPFAHKKDVLCVLGSDADGLRAAIAHLKSLTPEEAPAAVPPPAAPALVAQELEGTLDAQGAVADREGGSVLSLGMTPNGDRLAFGTTGYGRNVFVFDSGGKLLSEAQIGHLHATGVSFLKGSEQLAVTAEGVTYLCNRDGKPQWQLGTRSPWGGSGVTFDPAGRYAVPDEDGRFSVFDLSLKRLWGFDEWDRCETTREVLFGRQAEVVGLANAGQELVYRLVGKEPGAAGTTMDALIFAEALTGRELRRVAVDPTALGPAAAAPGVSIAGIQVIEDGQALLVRLSANWGRATLPEMLLDREFRPLLTERFTIPAYFGKTPLREFRQVVWERRQVFSAGDVLCLSDPTWQQLATLRTSQQIMALAVDLPRRRLAVANFGGQVLVVDERLATVFEAHLDGGARLAFLPDGRLLAGTLRGRALLFGLDGKVQWEQSLNRYVPPAEVEQGWLALEALPGPAQGGSEPWWSRLPKQVDLGPDLAAIPGVVQDGMPQEKALDGEPFGAYLVEWRYGLARDPPPGAITLVVRETERPAAGAVATTIQRLALRAQPGAIPAAEHAILRLGDRPGKVTVQVQTVGAGAAASAVAVRQLLFPSPDLVRMAALYRGGDQTALYVDPPCRVGMYMNVAEEGAPHTALRVMPEALVNGRMLEPEKELDKGLWWGGGAGAEHGLGHVEIPSWVELTLPRKKVLTHVVIAEDPALPRVEALTVDAYVESREVRQELTASEKRAVPFGFWHNLVKSRDHDSPYQVFRFAKPIYTDRLRVYVLAGHTALTEIEVYGALAKPPAVPQKVAIP